MTSRFGPGGSFIKRTIRRMLRFVTVPQDDRIAELERRVDAAGLPELRSLVEALSHDVLAFRSRILVLEAAAREAASRADLGGHERAVMLRLDAEAHGASAHRSFVEREITRIDGGFEDRERALHERIESLGALVRGSSAIGEASATLSALAGMLGGANPETARRLMPQIETAMLQLERLLGVPSGGAPSKNGMKRLGP